MNATPRTKLLACLEFAAFFALFFAYVLLRIDLPAIYDQSPYFPPFLTGTHFFVRFVTYPGGLTEYAAAFLAQSYFVPWLGALVVTGVAALLTLSTRRLVAGIAGVPARLVSFVPPFLMLLGYDRYAQHLGTYLAVLLAVFCATAYMAAGTRLPWVRLVWFLVLSVPLYLAVGGGFLLFAGLCGLVEVIVQGRRLLGLFCFLCAEIVPYVGGRFVYDLEPADAFSRLLPYHHLTDPTAAPVLAGFVAFFPVVALAAGVQQARHRRRLSQANDSPGASGEVGAASPPYSARRRLAACVRGVFYATVGVAVCFSYNTPVAQVNRLNELALRGRWDEVLLGAKRVPIHRYTYALFHNVNLALYKTGRLAEDLFVYPEDVDTLLVGIEPRRSLTQIVRIDNALQLAPVDLELGLANEADHYAYEALGRYGERPSVLRLLVRTSLARGEPDVARRFLRVLQHDLVWHEWAGRRLHRLQTDPELRGDSDLRRLRTRRLPRRAGQMWRPLNEKCRALLEHNPRNRMAFEYLMAFLLLTRNVDGVVANLDRLDDFQMQTLPRLYEEAVLIYEGAGKKADLHGRRISTATEKRFAEFVQVYNRFRTMGYLRGAAKALAETHSDSYFFYYYLGSRGEHQ